MSKLSALIYAITSIALSGTALGQNSGLQKRSINQFLAPATSAIAAHLNDFKAEPITEATQYFTPILPAGPNGKLQPVDRNACINVEGACIVGDYLYTYGDQKGVTISSVLYKFGDGAGAGVFNTTNALDPCRTLAADLTLYPIGTVIYIPDMKGKTCPQSGKPVDGAFIVGDKGQAISGNGRFDIFAGSCMKYSIHTNTCADQAARSFVVPPSTKFYVVPRDNEMAKALREQTDAFIKNDWK